ncbi:MAG TPA: carboxymuconolactone decarboxylase family protein [Thermaerobacter sp.]
MGERLETFRRFREEMNEKILAHDNLVVRRFFNLDSQTYKPGALPAKTKEMLGLVASLVLRCDDCVTYHMIQCYREGVTRDEFFEIFGVALVVGGSITIPHVRRAVAVLEELEQEELQERLQGPAEEQARE